MTRQTIEEKAAHFLIDHRVFVRWATPEHVCAVVRGQSGIYDVDLHGGRWSCSCASRRDCSHLRAVQLVTTPERQAVS